MLLQAQFDPLYCKFFNIYLASKSLMTKILLRSGWSLQQPIALRFLNNFISLRNFIIFSTSQFFPIVIFILYLILYSFLVVPPLRQSSRQYFIVSVWFLHVVFLHVGCWSFLALKYPWNSLVCPMQILLNSNSYCLQLLGALFNELFDIV